jgi:hypothetical protein
MALLFHFTQRFLFKELRTVLYQKELIIKYKTELS